MFEIRSARGFYKTATAILIPFIIFSIWYQFETQQRVEINQSASCIAAGAIFATLIIEYTLDAVVMRCGSVKHSVHVDASGKPMEHPLGHALILISLFPMLCSQLFPGVLPAFFVTLGQITAMTGILGKLQTFHPDSWVFPYGLTAFVLFLVSRLAIPLVRTSFPVAVSNSFTILLSLADCCLITMKYIIVRNALKIWQEIPPVASIEDVFTTRQFLCLILSTAAVLYSTGLLLVPRWTVKQTKEQQLETLVQLQIALVIMAAVLPGRVVRRGLIALKKEMEYKQTFVRYISHEVRSPLSTVALGLECLLKTVSTQQEMLNISDSDDNSWTEVMREMHEMAQDCKISCDLAISTLNDLLLYDKIESRMIALELHPVAFAAFLKKVLNPFKLVTMQAGLNFQMNINDDDMLMISASIDKVKVEQVVRNFLTNAIKFTPKKGVVKASMRMQPDFTLRTAATKSIATNVVRFEVTDSGAGISQANIKRLFGQYVQFEANKLQDGKGSGLGLWLSKAIIDLHGGVIGATSAGEGTGCTFFFELPCELIAGGSLCESSSDEADNLPTFLTRVTSLSKLTAPARSS